MSTLLTNLGDIVAAPKQEIFRKKAETAILNLRKRNIESNRIKDRMHVILVGEELGY